jgi:polyribonucleotide nucleotidyltransferase
MADVKTALKQYSSSVMRKMILEEGIRCDGRGLTAIRPIDIEQALLPRTHGSSLFTRGETQSLAICVLGPESMAQRYEDLNGEGLQRFYLQYFFPPFSVGEVGRIGPPGRREVGHGKLAERALQAILPSKETFPYTIRLESNITESNGSSSMASVCGGCLALMDAGVPIERPVSGIAMGLILEEGRTAILSDILGVEDALGDMDFKITGDQDGITAFQMDIKVEGITIDIMRQALEQAKHGRIHILNKMLDACPKPRPQMSIYAPRIETMKVQQSKIATIIGPGGKQIRAIIEETGVDITINDDGIINISAVSLDQIEKAKAIIHGLVAEAEIGKVYNGKITSIVAFGLFVEILRGKEGLLHISEIDSQRIENMFDYAKDKFKVGDDITVQVMDINERGQIKLSRRSITGGGPSKRHSPPTREFEPKPGRVAAAPAA